MQEETESLFQKGKETLERTFKKQIKTLEKRLAKAKEILSKCLNWEALYHEGILLQSNLYKIKRGMKEVHLSDWNQNNKEVVITLDPLLEPYIEIEKRFKISKKLKKGIPYQENHVKKIEQELVHHSDFLQKLSEVDSLEKLQLLQKTLHPTQTSKKSKEQVTVPKRLPFREFHSRKGLPIWVGKSAKDNELLTFHYAHGLDWWLHVKGFSGSHVVIKVAKGMEPDQETVEDAMQLALKYSKAIGGEAEVCITQCKNVTRCKGHVGRVYVSNQKTARVIQNPERLERLKSD